MGHQRWHWAAATAVVMLPAWLQALSLYNANGSALNFDFGTLDSIEQNWTPTNGDKSHNFNFESAQPMFNGQMNSETKFTFNMEYSSTTNDLEVMDAIAQYEPSDYFKVWAGRFLPPSDRANLYGPYYGNAWSYPGVVSDYPQLFEGRDNGAAVWGQTGGGKFTYQLGAFDGRHGDTYNTTDTPLAAGRLMLDLLDPEPGYYENGTYDGTKHILAIGIAGMTQKGGSGTDIAGSAPATTGDFSGWNADLLAEEPLGSLGTPTLEGAYYHYSSEEGVGEPDGDAEMVVVSYLLPGGIKPLARWQSFTASTVGATDSNTQSNTKLDLELQYIVHGANERFTLDYANPRDEHGNPTGDSLTLGGQFIY